jgi:ribonuclease HI
MDGKVKARNGLRSPRAPRTVGQRPRKPTMSVPAPHFLLFSSARHTRPPHESNAGRWHFVIRADDGSTALEASDDESEISRDRLELWAIVRGLEALDQPSSVTIITTSRYIQRGLLHGLVYWRENDWQWERFGQLAPVKNADLWRRIDHAMQFHAVRCRVVEPAPHRPAPTVSDVAVNVPRPSATRTGWGQRLGESVDHWAASLARWWPRPSLTPASTC